jgi:schlafen family protein
MLLSIISPSQDDISADIVNKVRSRAFYAGVLVKAALVRTQAGLSVSTVLAIASNNPMTERVPHEYGPLVLEEKWYSRDEFVAWVSTLAKTEKLQSASEQVNVKGVWIPPTTLDGLYVPSNYNYLELEWPSNMYRFMINQNTMYPPSEIPSPVRFPFFPSGLEATEWWFNVGDLTRLDLLGKITVMLPNYKARFREVEIGSKQVSFSVERLEKEATLLARLFMKNVNTRKTSSVDLVVPGNGGKFETESDFSYLKLVLVDQNTNEMLDYRDVYLTWGSLPKGVRREPSSEDILETIHQGEREDVEFKETITNSDDIVKTIAAMANTRGGVLFIGVNDDGQVVPLKEDLAVIEDRIRNWVRDWCEQSVPLTVASEKVLDQNILMVLVEQSSNRPCWIRGKGAYIRYGASNRHATRAEVEQMLRKETLGISVPTVIA